jgi:NAD-dependent dihydropyrimidine dehydrogenase PreA subunit
MTYIIGESCIDVKDKSCIDVCPVDCIHEDQRIKLGARRRADAGRLLHLASTTTVLDQATTEPTATSAVSEPRPLTASLG